MHPKNILSNELAGNLKHKENELLLDFMTIKNNLICSLIKNVIIKKTQMLHVSLARNLNHKENEKSLRSYF
jgi:hypothetical protein